MSKLKEERKMRLTPPHGIELMFNQNFPTECRCPFSAFVVAVHWAIVHTTNLRLKNSSTSSATELLPDSWESLIGIHGDATSRFIQLDYANLDTGRTVRVKMQELYDGGSAAVLVEEANQETAVTAMNISNYVDADAVREGQRSVFSVYVVNELWTLRDLVKKVLLDGEEDARILKGGELPKSPYASNLTKEQEERLELSRERRELERLREEVQQASQSTRNPLAAPTHSVPLPHRNPTRGIGSSDLDPFAGIGSAGGMLMDPRGFRRPQLPHGIPPGARFDPIGPIGGIGPRGGFGGPRLPFGMPDADHLPPNGFDDMFS